MFLRTADFSNIVFSTPLISIDLVVENLQGHILLGSRTNRAAKDYWIVPEGRIFKGESLDQAFERLSKSELYQQLKRTNGVSLEGGQHFYCDSAAQSIWLVHS